MRHFSTLYCNSEPKTFPPPKNILAFIYKQAKTINQSWKNTVSTRMFHIPEQGVTVKNILFRVQVKISFTVIFLWNILWSSTPPLYFFVLCSLHSSLEWFSAVLSISLQTELFVKKGFPSDIFEEPFTYARVIPWRKDTSSPPDDVFF